MSKKKLEKLHYLLNQTSMFTGFLTNRFENIPEEVLARAKLNEPSRATVNKEESGKDQQPAPKSRRGRKRKQTDDIDNASERLEAEVLTEPTLFLSY